MGNFSEHIWEIEHIGWAALDTPMEFITGLLQSVMFEVGWCELWGRDDTEETPFYRIVP